MYVNNLQENYKEVLEISKANMMESQLKWFHFSKDIFKLIKRSTNKTSSKTATKSKGKNKITHLVLQPRHRRTLHHQRHLHLLEELHHVIPIPPLHHLRSSLSPSRKTNTHLIHHPLNISKISNTFLNPTSPRTKSEHSWSSKPCWRFTKTKNPALRR